MKIIATLLAGAALALGGGAAMAQGPAKGEETLARMLEGRTAGEPTRCINYMDSSRLRVIDRVGVAYDAGKTVYVARAADPNSVRERDVLLIDRLGSRLCTTDVRLTVDRFDGALRSVVFLDDFVPYRRG